MKGIALVPHRVQTPFEIDHQLRITRNPQTTLHRSNFLPSITHRLMQAHELWKWRVFWQFGGRQDLTINTICRVHELVALFVSHGVARCHEDILGCIPDGDTGGHVTGWHAFGSKSLKRPWNDENTIKMMMITPKMMMTTHGTWHQTHVITAQQHHIHAITRQPSTSSHALGRLIGMLAAAVHALYDGVQLHAQEATAIGRAVDLPVFRPKTTIVEELADVLTDAVGAVEDAADVFALAGHALDCFHLVEIELTAMDGADGGAVVEVEGVAGLADGHVDGATWSGVLNIGVWVWKKVKKN
jgi:hypothetical protein